MRLPGSTLKLSKRAVGQRPKRDGTQDTNFDGLFIYLLPTYGEEEQGIGKVPIFLPLFFITCVTVVLRIQACILSHCHPLFPYRLETLCSYLLPRTSLPIL